MEEHLAPVQMSRNTLLTRMYSSRMRTARISGRLLGGKVFAQVGIYHTLPAPLHAGIHPRPL